MQINRPSVGAGWGLFSSNTSIGPIRGTLSEVQTSNVFLFDLNASGWPAAKSDLIVKENNGWEDMAGDPAATSEWSQEMLPFPPSYEPISQDNIPITSEYQFDHTISYILRYFPVSRNENSLNTTFSVDVSNSNINISDLTSLCLSGLELGYYLQILDLSVAADVAGTQKTFRMNYDMRKDIWTYDDGDFIAAGTSGDIKKLWLTVAFINTPEFISGTYNNI